MQVEVGGREVAVTNTDRVLFPDSGTTKGDLVAYYRDVAETMLPHVRARPLTLQRFPSGITGQGFFQKDASDHFPDWIERVDVPRREDGGTVHHAVATEPAALVYLANQGTVTFHVWTSRTPRLDRPDIVVIDIDPPDLETFPTVRATARALRDVLTDVGLVAYVQATGSKGLHVVAPLTGDAGYEEVHEFAHGVAEVVAAQRPHQLTVEVRKAKRHGRTFLDTNRNGPAQTFVAPYSVRPIPGAPVATPLDWDELGRVTPRRTTVANLRRRLAQKGDPWAGMDGDARPLGPARDRLARLRQ